MSNEYALSPEEEAIFGSPKPVSKMKIIDETTPEENAKARVSLPLTLEVLEPAAVLPPDAPANDADAPAPVKRRGKKKEAAPTAEAVAKAINSATPAVIRSFELPHVGTVAVTGDTSKAGHPVVAVTSSTGDFPKGTRLEVGKLPVAQIPDLAAAVADYDARVKERQDEDARRQPTITIELGPKTLAALVEALKR